MTSGGHVATCLDRLERDELVAVGAGTNEPLLRALEVAIYVEGALEVVLPESVLDSEHLGTPETAVATVAALLRER